MARLVKAVEVKSPLSKAKGLWNRELESLVEEARILDRMRGALKDKTIDLAVEMAGRIVGREVERDPEVMNRICEEALARMGGIPPSQVRVSPSDAKRAGLRDMATRRGFQVVADPEVEMGGCIVEAYQARVDARLEVVLSVMERALREGDW